MGRHQHLRSFTWAPSGLLLEWLNEERANYARLKHRTGPFASSSKRRIAEIKEELQSRGVNTASQKATAGKSALAADCPKPSTREREAAHHVH